MWQLKKGVYIFSFRELGKPGKKGLQLPSYDKFCIWFNASSD